MSPRAIAASLLLAGGAVACHASSLWDRPERFHSCRACLADDPQRCAVAAEDCGDLPSESDAKLSARLKLCDSLPASAIAERPESKGYTPTPWAHNACDDKWPASAFTYSCTPFEKTCGRVPIH